jgi:hypothetical protein
LSKPLTPAQVIELDKALVNSFSSHRALKDRVPAARYIKFPQIPAILAESFVIAGVNKLFGTGWKAVIGRPLSDIQLADPSGRTWRVEVKSTARHGFQELKAKDLMADALVWIHFGNRFYDGHGTIQVLILDKPGKHISGPIRLDIPRLMRRIGDTQDLRLIEVVDLEDFLSSSEG